MKIDPHILSQAAQLFDLHVSDLKPLGGMEGMALEFKRDSVSYVLKITPKPKDNQSEVRQLIEKLEFINFLAENGVRVAKPIRSPTEKWVETVEMEESIYLVNTLTKAEGKHFNLYNIPGGDPAFFRDWGQVTGQMHRLAKTYEFWQKNPGDGSPTSEIGNWKDEHQFFAGWCQYDDVRTKWIELGKQIEHLPRNRAGYGLIHNDLHPWNMIVSQQGKITVIDFDVCAYHYFIKDIAIALFHVNWSGNPGKGESKDDFLTNFFHNFMAGYTQENILDRFWFKQLAIFLKHHQILLFIVFTDEWKSPNKWQSNTLRKWRRQILNDIPVVKLQF
jgi:Ser/Thr protein kinase RdoA (MazF antagonist)